MKFLRYFSFILAGLAAFSCKNDLKLNAPYSEIPSIYAVLNPQEDFQTIRINKVFLGEGDANKMAKVADSVNYPAGELTVTLQRFVDGKPAPAAKTNSNPPDPKDMTIVFDEAMVTSQEGSFNTSQRVYATSKKLFNTGLYQLTVKNNRTGNVFKASAKAISPATPITRPLIAPYYPFPPNTAPEEYPDYSVPNTKYPYEVKHAPSDASIYQLTLRLHYYDSVSFNQNRFDSVEYVVGSRNIRELQKALGGNFLSHTFTGAGIFGQVGSAMTKKNHNIIGRKMYMIGYLIIASTQEYMDYMEYVRPSLSISQNKPLYSNFENNAALGLFTFRSTFYCRKNMSNFYINAFSDNPSTCSYKFFTSSLGFRGCK